ncbi:histone-lysine N-methyltransferase SETMAR-like [Octopus sinensis]|uniref:Histone-lysine N-methyltransferase SETMAR-like n=1 Tax=Octopus sinensis TaxID=2607531 RepID=A0A6P7T1Q9_9MOLL|nr:histone-lysine N-methyltransferase SETMAR-like [Octopus sinensis]
MSVQSSLIRELMLDKFELSHNAAEESKNICCAKGEVAVDFHIVTRWFKKFRWGCKNLDDQARSGMRKTVDSEVVLQAIEANPACGTRSVSGKLGLSQMYAIVQQKYLALVSRKRILLQQDNTRPDTAQTTRNKLQELEGINLMPHPAYSPNLAPPDHYLFQSTVHFLRSGYFMNQEEVEASENGFFASKNKN